MTKDEPSGVTNAQVASVTSAEAPASLVERPFRPNFPMWSCYVRAVCHP